MEIWGGNRAIEQNFEVPGLDVYVHSQPFGNSPAGGGDIYYLTSCASGRIARFLLADVSGHGAAVSEVAVSLRDLLRENVNKISQKQFVGQMNREFGELADGSVFATACVATFFEASRSLSINVAGHPHPLYYRASESRWVALNPAEMDNGPENLPLGILDESAYPGRKISTAAGDMFLIYSDAFIESTDESGKPLGIQGIVDRLNQNPAMPAAEVVPFLRETVGTLAADNLVDDDATLILGHVTETKSRLRDNLMAPFRMLGEVCDTTQLRS